MKKLFFLISIIAIGCSSSQKDSAFQELKDYEGRYEYTGETTLELVASALDTTLYAIIDNAKYPLKHIERDSFINIREVPVVFQRNEDSEVVSYTSEGQKFNLISKDFERVEMLPRKDLYKNPETYTYQKPEQLEDGLETGLLSEAFSNDTSIINMVKETIKGNFPEVHGILILKNDKLVLEEYFYGYDKHTPHQLRSASKPFIGALVGMAVDNNFIKSEDEKLIPIFKNRYEVIENMDNQKMQISIEDFLTYRHGMDCENNNPKSKGNEQAMMQTADWVKYTLDLPMITRPGEFSSYCSGCSIVLGSLVEVVTGMEIEEFAKKSLFEPMGITNYEWTFEPNPKSINTFNQKYLTPRDMVKLAKMYKDGGQWNERQIIAKSWVDKTFTAQEGDYGYLWEHKYFDINGVRYNSFLASGNGGQKINIWPELDMITVFTGGNYNSYELYGKPTPPNEMIPKYILKALE